MGRKRTNEIFVKARKRLLNQEAKLIRQRSDINFDLYSVRKKLKEWDVWLTG